MPISRGGKSTWENVVCACLPCNVRKGNKLLGECEMRLRRQPVREVRGGVSRFDPAQDARRVADAVTQLGGEPRPVGRVDHRELTLVVRLQLGQVGRRGRDRGGATLIERRGDRAAGALPEPGATLTALPTRRSNRLTPLEQARRIAGIAQALGADGIEIAENVGTYISSGIGDFWAIEREHEKLLKGGPSRVSPFFIPSSIINLAAGQVSIRFGAKGPNSATCTACSASAHAIGDAFEIISRGDCREPDQLRSLCDAPGRQ
jgi:hypothetical protein